MRRPQLRIRTLMLGMGIATLLVWTAIMMARSYVYGRLATEYELNEGQWRQGAARGRGDPSRARSVAVVSGQEIAAYYAPLAQKYRRAMWRPWVPIAPDPPAPMFGPAAK